MTSKPLRPIDESKLHAFMGKAVEDLGATLNAALVMIGETLGLYKAMAGLGPVTPKQLAKATSTNERYVREWLCAQAAGGYVAYDAATERFELPPEQAAALADESSPMYLPGAFQIASSVIHDQPKMNEAFRSGAGVPWHDHHPGLYEGTERFFRPNYLGHLVKEWIPALDGVEDKLKAGATVADVGCGHGASTIIMAQAYPKSRFRGFDYHARSIEWARAAATGAGVGDRVDFEVARAQEYPGDRYDFVAFFDCLHDMGDPVGAAAHVRDSLDSDGSWMVVEPNAGDRIEDNLTPVGRVFYSASTLICTPAAMAQGGRMTLGAQAGESRLRDVITKGGFPHVRRAAETPFNMVLEARLA